MSLVHLMTEDRTGGGLEALLRKEAQRRWAEAGKVHLRFSKISGTVNGNAALLEQCRRYVRLRFDPPLRADHVFYILDARNAENLPQLRVSAPKPPYAQSLPPFIASIQARMAELARGALSDEQWQKVESGFHAHLLVWERESLMLPVADKLGLGEAVQNVYDERKASELVTSRFRQNDRRRTYQKATDGRLLLNRIAEDESLRTTVIAANPSLQAILKDLTSLA